MIQTWLSAVILVNKESDDTSGLLITQRVLSAGCGVKDKWWKTRGFFQGS